MIFDLIFLLVALGALFTGFKNGLVKTILRGVFFVAGAIAAVYFVIEKNQSGWLILAIIAGAYAGAFLGTLVAKSLRITIIRGPLRLIDSLGGALLEVTKYVLLFYVIGTILLWAPWASGQNQISESKVYLQINKHAPGILADVRRNIEKALETNLRP
jgi:Colicin V production protein